MKEDEKLKEENSCIQIYYIEHGVLYQPPLFPSFILKDVYEENSTVVVISERNHFSKFILILILEHHAHI